MPIKPLDFQSSITNSIHSTKEIADTNNKFSLNQSKMTEEEIKNDKLKEQHILETETMGEHGVNKDRNNNNKGVYENMARKKTRKHSKDENENIDKLEDNVTFNVTI